MSSSLWLLAFLGEILLGKDQRNKATSYKYYTNEKQPKPWKFKPHWEAKYGSAHV